MCRSVSGAGASRRPGQVVSRGDLGDVVGEDAVPTPGAGAADGGEVGAAPAVVAFQAADAALDSGSPDEFGEVGFGLSHAPSRWWSAWSGDGDGVDTEVGEFAFDAGVS